MNEWAQAAAKWWTEQIQKPRFKNLSAGEERANPQAGLAGIMATLLVTEQSEEELAKFEEELTASLLRDKPYFLGVDYGPGLTLYEAAEKAGISPHNFPWKTGMWADEDSVRVSLGYQGPIEVIWEKPGEVAE